MRKEWRMRTTTMLGLLLMCSTAYADEEIADYRHEVMEAVGGHMQAIVKIAKSEVPFQAHLGVLAANMRGLSVIAGDIFPEGSEGGDALPEIWTEPDAFAERLTAFQDAASELHGVVASGDMSGFGDALQALGQSCKSCHDDFKEDD